MGKIRLKTDPSPQLVAIRGELAGPGPLLRPPNRLACALEGRITFPGVPSVKWTHLVGTPNPGKLWGVCGMARSIQYLDTAIVAVGTVEVEDDGTARQAVIDGFTLAVGRDGRAELSVSAGREVAIVTTPA
ncbi:hypothetical protein ACFU8W_38655 [Streptomyces sp. NPDC057565]|uniref:hypothetical protein n=1 Tax=Streptomyces sp. NPDC057565 TaxID=3346169 RepID=UPI00367BE19D